MRLHLLWNLGRKWLLRMIGMLFVLVSLSCHCVQSEVCYRNQQLQNQIATEKRVKHLIQCWTVHLYSKNNMNRHMRKGVLYSWRSNLRFPRINVESNLKNAMQKNGWKSKTDKVTVHFSRHVLENTIIINCEGKPQTIAAEASVCCSLSMHGVILSSGTQCVVLTSPISVLLPKFAA